MLPLPRCVVIQEIEISSLALYLSTCMAPIVLIPPYRGLRVVMDQMSSSGELILGTLPACDSYQILFSGGAEQFIAGPGSPNGTDFYKTFQTEGYNVVYNNTGLQRIGTDKKTLGIFSSQAINRIFFVSF